MRNLNRNVPSLRHLCRLPLLLLLIACLQASGKTFSQEKITIRVEAAEIKEVLRLIEKQSHYHFMYNEQVMSHKPRIDVDLQNSELARVLDLVLLRNGIGYRIVSNELIVLEEKSTAEAPADVRVSGRVSSENGAPLAGVSVTVKNTSLGTTTNEQGQYALTVPDNASVLVFSYVGYATREVPLGGRTEVNVTLASQATDLTSVVVVGYGTQRKRDVTGAVSRISGNEIARQPVLTATQGIQGKVAGVQIISSGAPNSAPIVRIRGVGSILGGANPLYVVDGIITDDIRNINTADITSVDVLKDASAAAIYGVRAANGVIIITTKKGRSGKMVVSYDANVGIRQATHLVKMANASEYATYINEASVNTGNGAVLVNPSATSTSTDWYGTILRTAFEQNHNVSISGGSDRMNYFLSAGYLNDEGIVINSKFRRLTVRSNNEYKLSEKLRVNTLMSFSNGRTQDVNLGSAYNNAYHAAPIIAAKTDGRYGNTSAYQNVGNPLLDIESNDNVYIENRFQGTGVVDYKPVPWLTLHSSFGADLGFNNRTVYTNQFHNDTATFLIAGGNQKNDKSLLSVGDERNTRWVWDNTATAQKTFGQHDVTLLVGTTAEKIFNRGTVSSRNDVPFDPNVRYLSQGDPSSQLNDAFADERTRNSYISRLSYSFKRTYLLTATFRADGSSQFSKKYSYSPAIGIGWILSNENFMSRQKLFDYLKLRASYGRLGSDNIPLPASHQTLNSNLPYFFNGAYTTGITFAGFVDKDIHWESTDESDIGLEFSMLKGRLSGEIDVYAKKVSDALIQVPVLISGRTQLVYTNVASIDNKGLELALQWHSTIGRKINYNVGFNASYNKNRVVALNGGQARPSGFVGSKGATTITDNGQEIGSFYVLQAEGVFHNQKELADYKTSTGTPITINGQAPTLGDLRYTDRDDNGVIDDNDRIYAGSYQPKFTLGLNSSFSYKNFDLSIAVYGTIGSKIYNGKKAARFNDRDNVEASVAQDRWTFSNYASDVPRATLKAMPHSTYFIESGDFARINNLTIGYTLPAKGVMSRIGISSLRVYVTAQNLATFTSYTGFTPELANSDPLSQGIELNAYPTTRTYAFGINLNF